jgi:ankyrin repeat protein
MADLTPLSAINEEDLASDYFSKLPSEIKLAIFQQFPFIDWVAILSPTCSDWRRICTGSKVPKELIVKKFVDRFRGIRSSAFHQIAKNFQVTGIDLEGISTDLYYHSDCSWIIIFAASSHLTWLNMKPIDDYIYNEDDLPLDQNTVAELSIESWDLIEEVHNAFPQITSLMVHSGVHNSGVIQAEVTFSQLKTLHTEARVMTVDTIKIFLATTKETFAPNLETIYLSIRNNRKDKAFLIQQYEVLEAYANSLNIKLYCRDLYLLVHDANLFITSFRLQDLPYSYYTYENKTLLGEAITAGSLPVVRFLLETKLTTLEEELGPYPLPNIFHRCIGTRPPSPPFLLPKHLSSERPVVDYLLDNGFDVNRMVNGKLLFEEQILHSPLAKYLARRKKVDWTNMTTDGYTVMHLVFEDDALELLKEIIRQTPDKDSMRNLLHLRDKDGNTPLHYLAQCQTQFIDVIAAFNPDWQIKNNFGQTPLLHWVKTSSADFLSEKFERIVALVTHVQEGVLTEIFRTQKDPEALEKNISILASKGINFKENMRGEPAVTHLHCFSAPLLKALSSYNIDITAVNGMKRSLLYNLIETSDQPDLLPLLVNEYKLNINHIDSNGMTPLIFAIKMQKDEVFIRKLLELGADPNLAGPNTPPALYFMRFHLDEIEEICELLLKAGADPNLRFINEDKSTTSFMALVTSHPSEELLQILIKHGGNVNERDEAGNTLLHIIDSKDQIKALLQYINVDTTNDNGETPLWGKVSDISPFINKRANVNHVSLNGSTALHTAMQNKDEEKAHALLAVQNIDLSLLDNCGRSFLHFIHRCPIVFEDILNAYHRQSEENKRKVKRAVNNVDFFGKTAVHYVVKTASETLVRSLVQTFELNVAPLTDYTPLHQCVSSLDKNYQASLRIAKFLCELGVDVNAAITSNNNTTLLILCAKHPHATEMKRILVNHGASITWKNNKGISAADLDPKIKMGSSTPKIK